MTFFWDEDLTYNHVGVWNTRLDCVNQDNVTLTKLFTFTILDGCSTNLATINDDIVHLGNYTLPTGEITFPNWDLYFAQPFGCPVTFTLTSGPSASSFSTFDDVAVSWTFESKTNNQAGWYNLTLKVRDVRGRIAKKSLTIYIKPECKFTVPFAIADSAMTNWVYEPVKAVSSGLFTSNNIDCGTIVYTPYAVVDNVNVPILSDPTFTNYV